MAFNLNPAQHQAVTAKPGNILVTAGAGSGKTRVLAERIGWLIREQGLDPYRILALTFTNKAAAEMRERMGKHGAGLWIGTFHGICHRILRTHAAAAGLKANFQIIDQDDQRRRIRGSIKKLKLDTNDLFVERAATGRGKDRSTEVMNWINRQKDRGILPVDVNARDSMERLFTEIYADYQHDMQVDGLVDFNDLLLNCKQLLTASEPIREHYQGRFREIFVDEFQDTNLVQYQILELLSGGGANVFAVGDADQSIYSWRGARAGNMQDFLDSFKEVELIKLEQNYRSGKDILDAANAVIANNPRTVEKHLWTERVEPASIRCVEAFDEREEADYIVRQIRQNGGKGSDYAVLYRNNAQAAAVEQALMREQIPYKVYGGLRFFERAEIKDLMAWIRLVDNPTNREAFMRASATPKRGIGPGTLEKLFMMAERKNMDFWSAIDTLPGKSKTDQALIAMKNTVMTISPSQPLPDLVEQAIRISGLGDHYEAIDRAEDSDRSNNIMELIAVAQRHRMHPADMQAGVSALSDFIASGTLDTDERASHPGKDPEEHVQLMTLHSAKGLEFPTVFIIGMENGLFPSSRSEDPENVDGAQEERRLAYVGITRAMDTLNLCHAGSRMLYGQRNTMVRSRYIDEIEAADPAVSVAYFKHRFGQTTPATPPARASSNRWISQLGNMGSDGLRVGQPVAHARFGRGVVVRLQDHGKITAAFGKAGMKTVQACELVAR